MVLCQGWDLRQVCPALATLATHLDTGTLSFPQCGGDAQLLSGSLSEGTALCADVHSMCPWEEESSGPPITS